MRRAKVKRAKDIQDVILESLRRAEEDGCARIVYTIPKAKAAIGVLCDDKFRNMVDNPTWVAWPDGKLESLKGDPR